MKIVPTVSIKTGSPLQFAMNHRTKQTKDLKSHKEIMILSLFSRILNKIDILHSSNIPDYTFIGVVNCSQNNGHKSFLIKNQFADGISIYF